MNNNSGMDKQLEFLQECEKVHNLVKSSVANVNRLLDKSIDQSGNHRR
jgi:hypothetical protein